VALAQRLEGMGFRMGRQKTGTPPPHEGTTIDLDRFTPQPGDEGPVLFHAATTAPALPQLPCHNAYTSPGVHALIPARRVLGEAARVIVTSPGTRDDLAEYGVEAARIGIVLPGTEPAPLARGSGGDEVTLLCVASLTARKGHLVLLEALAALQDLPWRLICIGSPERDPATAHAIGKAIEAHGLGQRVALVGEQSEADLQPRYDTADLFVLASHHEGYGMVLAEALARGLPIVSTTAGAIPDTVPAAAGVLVPPGDPPALAAALRRVISMPEVRRQLAAGAARARASLPDWPAAAGAFAAELAQVAGAA
jgi:glycosyltransferase involved in cell wall biosynthesis